MPRFILQNIADGNIYADTADLAGWRDSDETPEAAARLTDALQGFEADEYVERAFSAPLTVGYRVYRADIDGSEAVGVVADGTDRETIEAVQASCQPWCSIERVAHAA
jgi:hypothetical protein